MLCRYWMMASTSCGLNTKMGMSGWPETIPSANDSARLSMGYLLDRVQNGGACGCGLSPSLPMAWQREQFFSNSIVAGVTSPLFFAMVLSAGLVIAVIRALCQHGWLRGHYSVQQSRPCAVLLRGL